MKQIRRLLLLGLVVLTAIAAAAPVSAPATAGDALAGGFPVTSDAVVDGMPRSVASDLNVNVSVAVLPSRLIVVDENDRIIEVYSNTRTLDHGSYALRVREQDQFGPEHALTDNLLVQYERLMTEVDWDVTGQGLLHRIELPLERLSAWIGRLGSSFRLSHMFREDNKWENNNGSWLSMTSLGCCR